MRIAAVIEYDGSNYRGWQSQTYDQLPTLQETIEKAIAQVADHPVSIVAAGRTDAGVHATAQVIHFDTTAIRANRAWLLGINTNLPNDICVRLVRPVSEHFHARFSATARRYQYLIFNSPVRSAIMHNRATVVYQPLNAEVMHQAAQYFIGEHDFTSLRAAGCQSKSPMRNVHYVTVQRHGSWITCEVQANAFLHHMVRNMVGVLLTIGLGKKEMYWAKEVLEARDRTQSGITAPAQGLYLVKVLYPEHFKSIMD